jgi:acetyl-CoA carboxylase alpha subunit
LGELSGKSVKELLDERYDKFRAMGRIGQDLVEA